MRRTRSAAGLLAIAVLGAASALLAGCNAAPETDGVVTSPATGSATSGAPTGHLTVFAAASLSEVFTTLGAQFSRANPGTSVTFSFGASSTLATQIAEGAPADVFASASETNMAAVVAAKAAAAPTVFARNVLEIAVPPDNPAHVTSLADLARAGVKVALCQPEVPCGAAAAQVFSAAGLTVTPVTLEPDVKATLTKVELGEVDAGVVYVTDVRAAGAKVAGIVVPPEMNVATRYPIAALTPSTTPQLARAFVAYVLSAPGQSALAAAGFEKP